MNDDTVQIIGVAVIATAIALVIVSVVGYATWTNLSWAPAAAEIEKARVNAEGQAKLACINAGGTYENSVCKWGRPNPAEGG